MSRILAGVVVAIGMAVILAVPVVGQACDPSILRNARGPHGYQSRGDRCEGLYATDVAATTMWVASFVDTFRPYDLQARRPLILSWRAPGQSVARVRAQSTKRDLYYRMDVERPAGSAFYEWPTDFLQAREIQQPDIGLLAWTEVNGAPLFLPLRVEQGGEPAGDAAYELTVIPNVRLREVYVSLAPATAAGQRPTDGFLKLREPLGKRLYPTQRPVVIPIADLPAPGVYFVEVSAERRDGRSETMDGIWFYHAGR